MDAIADLFRRLGALVRRHPWKFAAALPLLFVAGTAVVAALYVAAMVPLTPSIADIQRARIEKPSTVLSADGQALAVFRRTNREWVKLSEVSPTAVAALIATEDRRFYDHRGLDLRRTLSAAMHTARGNLQGGSTITQQLARNLFPEEIGRAPTIERKVKEAITALKIEKVYSKDEILEIYLNTVPFLYNAYGIEMAARTYFDKSASDLDILQAATLVGMLKGTSYYNPVLNPERAVQRRNTVLAQLVRTGQLSDAQFASLKARPLGLDFEKQEEDLGPAPHLAQQLKRWLITWADTHGYNMYADGLVVRTTIDSRLQQYAVDALTRQADKLQETASRAWAKPPSNRKLLHAMLRDTPQYRGEAEAGHADAEALKHLEADAGFMKSFWAEKTVLQAAFLAQDPVTGHVKAWVGSRDFRQDQFDHVQQARRQPGSTFKPFVYGAAFAQGISPAETFIDEPVEIRIDAKTTWKPGDVHETSGLPTTLRDGLVYSKNSITAQLMQRVGPARVAQVAQAMGVRQSKLDVVPSLALGTSPVTLKEMVSAYGTIANSGTYVEPVLVLHIENAKGEILEDFQPRAPEAVLPLDASVVLLDVMRGVIDEGTGAGIRSRFGLRGDLAGKTGTTQDNTDGWFILMHPRLVAGAWVGFNDARLTMGDSWGQGARNALLIVGDFMQQATKAKAVDAHAKFAAPRQQYVPAVDPAAIAATMGGPGVDPLGPGAAGTGMSVPAGPDSAVPAPPAVVRRTWSTGSAEPVVVVPDVPRTKPEFGWTIERQRSREFQDSPGFSPGPAYRPPATELGAARAEAPPPPAEPGIRILRSY